MLDGHNGRDTAVVINAVDDSVIASPGAAQSLQAELEFLVESVTVRSQGSADEFDGRGSDFSGILVSARRDAAVQEYSYAFCVTGLR